MSFLEPKSIISEGDTVIIYLTVNNMHAIDVLPLIKTKKGDFVENVFQTSFGALKVKTLVGVSYGSKVELSRGWAYVLQPTPELWTLTLPHRTQIIYTPDISMVLFQLEIKPGSVVIESGTGSGSLSHSFIRALKPHGHLHTFDFHEARVEQARDEFTRHGIADFVTVYHRDVIASGFSNELEGKADAVFLDLPAPWAAIEHSVKSMKESGGRFCSFSPCIEQSQRCCETLLAQGFVDIQSMEILQIEESVKTKSVPIMDLEFLKHKKSEENSSDNSNGIGSAAKEGSKEIKKYLSSSSPHSMPGHTGYLTFATLPPLFARIK